MFSRMYFSRVPAFGIFGMEEAQIAATLTDADDNLFVLIGASPLPCRQFLPPTIGFVHFDFAARALVLLTSTIAARMR